jgi:hypothetical protein
MCNNLWTTPMRAMEAAPDTLWSILTGQARGPSLEPGDAILLAESADFSMPVESPVPGLVLRSANTRAPAVFTKTVRLTQAGQKLERVKIVPGAEPAAVEISAPNCEVAWCEVTGFAARGIVIQKGGTGAHIHHNWVHDQAPLVGAAVAGIIAGTGRGTTADSMKALIELNLIERLRAFQAIEFKSSDNTAQLNTVLDGGEIVVRHGSRNRTIANWVENGRIGLCGDDPVSMFDRVFGRTPNRGPSGIAIRAGTIPPGPPQASEYVPARRAIIIETDSDIIDGWIKGDGWTVAPVDSRSRRFRGRIERGGRPGGVRVDDDASAGRGQGRRRRLGRATDRAAQAHAGHGGPKRPGRRRQRRTDHAHAATARPPAHRPRRAASACHDRADSDGTRGGARSQRRPRRQDQGDPSGTLERGSQAG